MHRPNKILYIFLNRLASVYSRIYKNHHFHNPNKIKIKTPSIIISNHTSFFDFLYVMRAAKHTPINFVVARKYCETKPLSTILKLGQAIPKSLFQPDVSAIKNILEILNKKGVIGIFPEGQISATGVTLKFPSGIGKLVKKSLVHVYAVKTTGAYLMDPPWTNVKRKGRIDSELFEVLTPDVISNLTVDEIESKLYNSIYTNPYYNEHTKYFKGKNLAKDLDKLIYTCINCNSEGKMETHNNELICQECKSVYHVFPDGKLSSSENKTFTIEELYKFQRNSEKQKILKNPDFSLTLDVKVESIVQSKYKIISHGKLKINQQYIEYLSEDEYSFKINSNIVRYVPFDNGRNFQIYRDDKIYQFIPQTPYLCSKATNIIEVIYELNNPE